MESTGTLPRRRLGLNALWVLVFLAWRNLWRNRLRSLLTAGAMVVGLTLMIGYMALIDGLFRQMVGFATDIAIGHIQLHRQAYIDDQDLYAVLPLGLVEHLERTTPYLYAPRSYAAGLASAGDSSSGALLKGVEPGQEVEVTDLHRRLRRGTFDLRGSTPPGRAALSRGGRVQPGQEPAPGPGRRAGADHPGCGRQHRQRPVRGARGA
jgi:ABC-type lipoprotein release transport system permease subunit